MKFLKMLSGHMDRHAPVWIFVGVASLVFLVTSFLTGCKSTLAPGGAYSPITISADGVTNAAPDMPLFVADSAYELAYTAINAVFTVEYNNRDLLFKTSPTIKHSLDSIRPDAVKANADYLKARAVYIANPTQANLTGVQAVLAKIQQLATAAQAALPKQ